jgi:hypothetical protein
MTEHALLLREIASWRFAAELARRYPGRFTIIETHPGGGLYDCLSIYARTDPHGGGHIDLNRLGSAHILRPFGPDASPQSLPGFWDDLLVARDPKTVLDEVCRQAGLPQVTAVPPPGPDTLSCRFIAAFLSHAILGRAEWTCRSGYLDSADGGDEVRRELFDPFPSATRSFQTDMENDVLGQPAYRFWFLVHEGPRLCVELPAGAVHDVDGNTYDLRGLYRRHRRIWPIVQHIAGHLLP